MAAIDRFCQIGKFCFFFRVICPVIIIFIQVFAWEAYERGADVHLQADPTKLELLSKTFKVKKEGFKSEQKSGILDKV